MGLKITACIPSWGKFWTKDTKRPENPTATFEEPGAKAGTKAGYCACPLHTTPPKGWANHLSHPSGLTPGHTPTLTPRKEPARPPSGSEQERKWLLVFAPPCRSRGPDKVLPEFPVWALVNFYWLGKAKNSGRYQKDQRPGLSLRPAHTLQSSRRTLQSLGPHLKSQLRPASPLLCPAFLAPRSTS